LHSTVNSVYNKDYSQPIKMHYICSV